MSATEICEHGDVNGVTLDPRVARSRAKVLEAATELLVEGGPRAVTVDAVAERSGVAKSTMYRHFPSRTDLLVEVLRHNAPAVGHDTPPGPFEPALRALVQNAYREMTDPDWARILPALMSLKATIPGAEALTEADRAAHLELLAEVLARGVAEGVLRPDVDPATALALIVGPLLFAVLHGDIDRLPTLPDEIVDQFIAGHRVGT